MNTDESFAALQGVLAGDYTIEKEIGRGGMGVVYRAHDNRYERTVAIKVLREEIGSGISAARFNREIRIEARLQHPNIVPVHEWGERDGLVFCVMPLVEGESLRARLDREKQLGINDAIRIAREVASALAYAHQQGVVHRDVKPENILLSSGHAMITDFGVARVLGSVTGEAVTETGFAVGTVSYMSPEQAAGDSGVDARSDIYALGCVLYEMLGGSPPFGIATPRIIIARHMNERPPRLEATRPSVPPYVLAALDRALEKVPADRFATASEFAAALEVSGATPAGVMAAVASRRRSVTWAVLLAVPLLVAGGFYWSRRGPPLDANRVVVFPLTYSADSANGAASGWDVAIAISASLEHAEPLRVIDGYTHLPADVRKDIRLLTDAAARSLSRERAARYYVDGAITRRNDSATVVLRLHDALGDSLLAQESSSGAAATPAATLGLRAVARLLPRLLDPTRRVEGFDLESRAPSAVALWIQGEREYRQSHFAPALELFRRAIREDSALAIAAVRGAQAASWESRLEEAEVLAELAVSRKSTLSRRQALFADGLWYYLRGDADSARASFERELAIDADGVEPAMALAEVYQHLLSGPSSPPDSAVEHWLNEAVRRDSSFTPPLLHLAEITLRRGDLKRADALITTLSSRGAESFHIRHLQLMHTCVRGADAKWVMAANVDPETALTAATELLAHFAQPRCAEAGLRAVLQSQNATPGVRWSALLRLQGLLVATRRDIELRALLDSAVAAGTSQARALYIIDAVAGVDRSLMRPKAEEAATFAQQAYGPAYERASPQTRWVLGNWHALERDTTRLAAMRRVSDSVGATGGRREQLFAGAMRAHVLLASGDTTRAIAALRALVPTARRDSLTYELFEPLALERTTLALLQFSRGSYADALATASLLEHSQPAIYLAFLPLSLDLRARAADKLDRRSEAEQYRARLRALQTLNVARR
ncbi:MAG: protein kinase [bacterium]